MFCLQIACLAQRLSKILFLALSVWQGFCRMTGTQTERTEEQVIPTGTTQYNPVNSSFVALQIDTLLTTAPGSFDLSNFEAHSDVTRIMHTKPWKFLDGKLLTSDSNPNRYDVITQIDERNKSETIYQLGEAHCWTHNLITVSGRTGVVYGVLNSTNWPREKPPYCMLKIVVPEGKYVEASFDFFRQMGHSNIEVSEDPKLLDSRTTSSFQTSDRYFPLVMSGSNQIFFRIEKPKGISEFKLRFTANEEDLRVTLPLVPTSPTSGYVTTWGFETNRSHPCFMNASRIVHVPPNNEAMVSFTYVDIFYSSLKICSKVYIQVYETESNGRSSLKIGICINSVTPALVLKGSFEVHFYSIISFGRGFKMIFSFHPVMEVPSKTDRGQWLCSTPHYNTFQQHLECNMEPECQGGEDEGAHCPYSSPACNGSVAVGNKCYVLIKSTKVTTWSSASRECRNRGGNLANIKTKKERDALDKIYQFEKSPLDMFVGLSTYDGTLPLQYKKLLTWSDGTVAYAHAYLTSGMSLTKEKPFCFISWLSRIDFFMQHCNLEIGETIPLCEFSVTKFVHQMSVQIPLVNSEHITNSNDSLYVSCTEGHFTFDFLSCDKASHCDAHTLSMTCQTVMQSKRSVATAMFVCLDHSTTLPYSLVCDFRPDCPDASDENFCKRNLDCDGFRCLNGQCINPDKTCDGNRDCWDASDEDCGLYTPWATNIYAFLDPPAVIDFSHQNDVVFSAMNISDLCPPTHFRCPPDGYCLPVYVRCNGVYDCPYHEDEEDCESYTCPGFYRCRASTVCVHADHMCDGRPQCPQHDDEVFCQLSCPQGCLCQGLAFVCSEIIKTQNYPAVRYLDASGSGMSTEDINPSIYLIWLSIAANNLQFISNMSLPSLQSLDLSNNLISWLDMSYFIQFENLRVLRLAGNPLQSLLTTYTARHSLLTHLDVSRTLLTSFEGDLFSNIPDVQVLNLSFSLLTKLSSDSFKFSQNLTELDMRGNDIKTFHNDVLKHLMSMRVMYVSSYILCCKEFLPDVENVLCFSPTDSFSSCQSLLSSKSVFVVLWILCAISFIANICCAFYSIFYDKEKVGSAFSCLMINLNVSDMFMSVYLFVIATVDQMYRDHYMWYEQTWTGGYLCQITGLVYIVSTEVSFLTIFLMTVERLFAVRFRAYILNRNFLPVACCSSWVISLVLAILPFSPFTPLFGFYTQNSVCAPIPVYSEGFIGWPYAFGIVGLNLVLILAADLVHGVNVCSLSACLPSLPSASDQTSRAEKVLARRLTFLLVTKTLSSSLLSVIAVMTRQGTPYPVKVINHVTLLISPLNASLNPVMYAVTVFLEKRRESQRLRLLRVLQTRYQKSSQTSIFTVKTARHSFQR